MGRGGVDSARWWCRAAAALLLCAALAACSRTPPEQALREAMQGVQAAIEARDAGELAGFLAEDFIGPGRLDRDGARRMAALHFMRHGEVGVAAGPLDIELHLQMLGFRTAGCSNGLQSDRWVASRTAWIDKNS